MFDSKKAAKKAATLTIKGSSPYANDVLLMLAKSLSMNDYELP